MVAQSQPISTEDSAFALRRRKLSLVARPFPAGFIPVVQQSPSNPSEIKQDVTSPVFLPADLPSPLPPSRLKSMKQGSKTQQDSLPQLPLPSHPTANNQSKLIPSIKRLCSNVRLGQRQLRSSMISPHFGPLTRSPTDQTRQYSNSTLGHSRTSSSLSPKKSYSRLRDAVNHHLRAASPTGNPDDLKKPSLSSKVIKKAQSVGDLRTHRKRSISINSISAPCSERYAFPGAPTHHVPLDTDLNSISAQVRSISPSRNPYFPRPTSKQGCTPVVSNHPNGNQSPHQDSIKPTNLPYYIELESIEMLERACGKISPSLETFMIAL